MGGWYVRRSEKVVGPVEIAKLRELASAGKLVPTDQLAKDVAGPWTEAARTNLFAKANVSVPVVATATLPVKAEVPAPVKLVQQEVTTTADSELRKSRLGFISTAGSAVGRSMSERAKRKHEVKLAKIQADALADSRRPVVQQSAPPPPAQSVNVNVVQNVNVSGIARKRWSRAVAMLLSLIIPGLGQLYKGQVFRALL
jgi:hypothetical protein